MLAFILSAAENKRKEIFALNGKLKLALQAELLRFVTDTVKLALPPGVIDDWLGDIVTVGFVRAQASIATVPDADPV